MLALRPPFAPPVGELKMGAPVQVRRWRVGRGGDRQNLADSGDTIWSQHKYGIRIVLYNIVTIVNIVNIVNIIYIYMGYL